MGSQIVQFFLEELSIRNVIGQLFWTVALAGLGRGLMVVIGRRPTREWLYWVVVTALVFAVLMVLRMVSDVSGQRPRLHLAVEAINIGRVQDEPLVLVIMSISNTGMPSIAEGFTVTATPPGSRTLEGTLRFIPDKVHAGNYTFRGSDAIYHKAMHAPIPRGGKATGLLMAVFPRVNLNDIQRGGTKMTIGCRDVFGNRYSVIHEVGSESLPATPYVPGLQPPEFPAEEDVQQPEPDTDKP